MKYFSNHYVLAIAVAISLATIACSNEANNCSLNSNCVPPDAGQGGTSATGGNTSVGGSTSVGGTTGVGGGNTTGGFTSACNPTCSGSKPICNETAKACVECTGDGNCSGTKPACNLTSNACVECIGDGNCGGSKPVCDLANNTCVECIGDSNCSGTKSTCNTTTSACVRCTKDTHCSGSTPRCDLVANICIQCKSSTDCTDATASLCNAGTCSPCAQDADCSHISNKNVCTAGACVQCTVANETACDGTSCNPKTSACTDTPMGSVGKCQPCRADSECIGGDPADGGTVTARCVPMTFGSSGQAHGNYCLQTVASAGTSGCARPYTTAIAAASLSGVSSTEYCGINQLATTCEAVLDLIAATKTCSADTECGSGQNDGLCKTVGTNPNRCTIPCISSAECLTSPAPGSTCTTDVPYCH